MLDLEVSLVMLLDKPILASNGLTLGGQMGQSMYTLPAEMQPRCHPMIVNSLVFFNEPEYLFVSTSDLG